MKCRATVALLLLLPASLAAQEVRVRLFTAHPPTALTLTASSGTLQWRVCSSCEQQSGKQLSIKAPSAGETSFFVSGQYELRSPGAPDFKSHFPLEIRSARAAITIIVTLPLETYVQHVLMAESGDFKNDESLKAMAIAVRTYALRFSRQHAKDGFDFCDTTHCQVVHWKPSSDRVRAAAEATAGKSLAYRGGPAATYYHQDCGGTTAAASEAWNQASEIYLLVHADSFCTVKGGLKWETILTHEQIDRALHASSIEPPPNWAQLEIRSRTKSGRAQKLNLAGWNSSDFSLSASSFRFAINRALGWNKIRSDLYDARNSGDKVLFSGRGSGHGVGLCQSGAEEMARQGKSFEQILRFYFPGTELIEAKTTQTSANADPWQKRSDERFDLLSTRPDTDTEVLPVAEHALRESETSVGRRLPFRPRLQVFATLDRYRDSTGQPGWIAASTRGHTIRLQPLAELRHRGVLESTLRHELTHLLVESRAKDGTPLWFREGLVLFCSGAESIDSSAIPFRPDRIDAILASGDTQENTRRAYQSAQMLVRDLIQANGKEKVLGWLSSGLPRSVLAAPGGSSEESSSH